MSSKPTVFISYRRDDAASNAGRLFDWLVHQFGDEQVFLDTSRIALGDEFPLVLQQRLAAADVVLVVIGPQWLDIADAGGRRLDQPNDYVRIEVAAALEAGKRVIPVLVGGARMPGHGELPEALRALSDRNGMAMSDARFEQDFDLLVNAILGRPRGYLKTELDRLQRLLRAIRLSTLLVPTTTVMVVLAIWIGLLEALYLDTRAASYLMWAGEQISPAPSDPGVVLVTIDEHSEQRLQRAFGPDADWRRDHARLIERAAAAGARAVVFDMFFERESTADAVFAAAARRARGRGTRVVFGARTLDGGRPRIVGALYADDSWGSVCINRRMGFTHVAPLAVLVPAGPDTPYGPVQGAGIPSLSLVAARSSPLSAVDIDRRQIVMQGEPRPGNRARFSLIRRIGSRTGACGTLQEGDDAAMLMIRFADAGYWQNPARRVSYADLLDGDPAAVGRLSGRVVLVGVTLGDTDHYRVVSGFDRHRLYGVELHANAIANLLHGREMVTTTLDTDAVAAIAAATAGALLGYLTAPWSRWLRRVTLVGVAFAYLGLGAVLAGQGVLINVLYHSSGFLITFIVLRRLRQGRFEHRDRSVR